MINYQLQETPVVIPSLDTDTDGELVLYLGAIPVLRLSVTDGTLTRLRFDARDMQTLVDVGLVVERVPKPFENFPQHFRLQQED